MCVALLGRLVGGKQPPVNKSSPSKTHPRCRGFCRTRGAGRPYDCKCEPSTSNSDSHTGFVPPYP
eukprot:3679727-Alexandrium_andersonii.AAC.1